MTTDATMAPRRHGTLRRFNKGCRCAPCRRANSRYVMHLRAVRITKPIPDHVPHGAYSTYVNYACRCDPCRGANAEARRAQRRAHASEAGR